MTREDDDDTWTFGAALALAVAPVVAEWLLDGVPSPLRPRQPRRRRRARPGSFAAYCEARR